MSDERMGDDVYQPDNEEQADAAPLDLENALDEPDYDDILDEGYSPPEKPLGLKTGITAAEQRDGESLDQRLAEEVPDIGADLWADGGAGDGDGEGDLVGGEGEPFDREAGVARSGRLVAPDDESDLVAFDVGIDAGAASAEEAAMHIVPDDEEDDEEDED